MTNTNLHAIHESLLNGQRKQMVKQIEEYGLYDFWGDYKEFLVYVGDKEQSYNFFTDATISYFRIKNR